MSCSMPDVTWLSISKELEKVQGVFLLKNLPDHNYKKLAAKILRLKKMGVKAPIQINPQLFHTYNIQYLPTFVLENLDLTNSYKISADISLEAALGLIAERTESLELANLRQSLQKLK